MVDIISDIKTPTEYFILCGDVRKNQELVKSDDPKEYRFPDIPGSKWARMRDMLQEKLEQNKQRPGCEFLRLLDKNPNLFCLNPAFNGVEFQTEDNTLLGTDLADVADANAVYFDNLKIIPTEEFLNTLEIKSMFETSKKNRNTDNNTTRYNSNAIPVLNLLYDTAKGSKDLDVAKRLKRYMDTNFIQSNIKGDKTGCHGALFRGIAIGGYINYDKFANYINEQTDYKKLEKLSTYPKICDYLDNQYSDIKKLNKYLGVIASANIFLLAASTEDRKFFQTDKVLSALYSDPGRLVKLPEDQFNTMLAEASRVYKNVFLAQKTCDHDTHMHHETMIKNINPQMFNENVKIK